MIDPAQTLFAALTAAGRTGLIRCNESTELLEEASGTLDCRRLATARDDADPNLETIVDAAMPVEGA